MYVRPPNQNRERIRVPENYRGNVFASSGEYTDMPPPTRLPHSSYDLPPERYSVTPENDRNNVSDGQFADMLPEPLSLPEREDYSRTSAKSKEATADESYKPEDDRQAIPASILKDSKREPERSSLFSLLMPPSSNALHFPFGHGIGSEELLILGIMLLIFLHGSESGEPDNEFLLLLALLLFAG